MTKVSAVESAGLVLAGLRQLIDNGSLQNGEAHLATTAREAVVKVNAKTAADHGLIDGNLVVLEASGGKLVIPVEIAAVADQTIWLPLNSDGSTPLINLGITIGDSVSVKDAGAYVV